MTLPDDAARADAGINDDLTVPMISPTVPTDGSMEYPPGTVFGSYRLVKQIGAGGMGQVFIAEHMRLGRQVALKVLHSEFSGNREAVKRFFAEAQAVNRINHENIIEVSDFIENPTGASFCIMELLKGVDLRTLEDREGALSLSRAVSIAVQVCRGLGAAHDARIVHRDLKPDNIFLVERGRTDFVKLLDFGVAKLMDANIEAGSTFRSTAGIVVGTPQYMSPEQAMGEQVDHRSDIYSMGVIMFEMVTGRLPFEARSAREIMAKHLMVAPPRPSRSRNLPDAVPQALEDLILSCLRKEPRDRPQSIKEIEEKLEEIRSRLPNADPEMTLARRLSDKRVWLATAGALVVTAGLVALSQGLSKTPAVAGPSGALGREVSPGGAAGESRQRVQMTFRSTPSGATVFRVGDARPLGVTPFSAEFGLSSRSEVFEFRLEGWKVGRRHVALLVSGNVELALTPIQGEPGASVGTRSLSGASAAKDPGEESDLAKEKHKVKGQTRRHPTGKGSSSGASSKSSDRFDQDAVMNPFE